MKLLRDLLVKFTGKGEEQADRTGIIEGLVHSLVIQGGSIVLIFAGNLLMARWAGAAAYGRYVHIFNWVSILSIAAVGGLQDIALVRIPRYLSDGQADRIPGFVRRANGFILLSSVLAGGLFLLIIYTFPLKTLHENRQGFLLAGASVYFLTFLTVNQSVLQSMHFIRQSQWVEKWIKPFLLLFFFLIVYLVFHRADSTALVVLGTAASGVCCFVLGIMVWKKIRAYKSESRLYPRENRLRQMGHFFSIDLLNLLGNKLTMLMLPYFFSQQTEVGIFNVSYRFADLVIYPFFLMNTVMPQQFSGNYSADTAHKQFLYRESTRLMTFFAVPLLLMNVVAGKLFLSWFGPAFISGYTALVELSLAQCMFSLFGPAHTILTMLDKEKYAVLALLIYVIVLFAGNLLLMPSLGVNGGTLSVIIGTLCYNLVLAGMAWKFCGVYSPFMGWLIRPLRKLF